MREGTLSEVDLSGFSEDIESKLPAIYEAAASSKTLERFAATNPQHGAAAKSALVTMVEKSPSLRELDARFCGLGDRDLVRLLEAATHSPRLEVRGIAKGEPSKAFTEALENFASSKARMRWLRFAQAPRADAAAHHRCRSRLHRARRRAARRRPRPARPRARIGCRDQGSEAARAEHSLGIPVFLS